MGNDTDQVLQFLPWAKHFARTCSARLPRHLDHEDLEAAGILGYLRAASRYNIKRGASFRGYCAARIRGAVLDEVRRWDWAPRSVHANHRRITRITLALCCELEREPTRHELASALGVKDDDLATIQAESQPRQVISFDEVSECHNGEDSLPLQEKLADPDAVRPDACVLGEEDRRLLTKAIGRLPKTQATVVVLHYLQAVPLREVAKLLSVTPSRVSQLHQKALVRLRQTWQSEQ